MPLVSLPNRIREQTFGYDRNGNITDSSDDTGTLFDRSQGPALLYGTPTAGPNQLVAGYAFDGTYDLSGNLTGLRVVRGGECPNGAASHCGQWFTYDWDEVGQLVRARRWDFDDVWLTEPPASAPAWTLDYAYTAGARVRKSAKEGEGPVRHTLEIFDTLRLDHASFDEPLENYKARRDNMHVYVGGTGHVFNDADARLPHPTASLLTMHLQVGDHLGSTSMAIDYHSSEVVERTTYQPYGALESDYRPERWASFREDYKFTGKEEDIEVGATYFGARYYNAHLGRFMSPDPLTIHGMGADLNPYAYVGGRVTSLVDPWGLEDDCPADQCTGPIVIVGTPPTPTPPPGTPPTPSPSVPGSAGGSSSGGGGTEPGWSRDLDHGGPSVRPPAVGLLRALLLPRRLRDRQRGP
jgi:RHS repeat-associated protein